mmetsp:Transcript_30702/g.69962  ORF Transcript_30702/g.69962 Transcript_30702/m.69962 type:complete len:91 (+) Transcript_30702:257-529(+)
MPERFTPSTPSESEELEGLLYSLFSLERLLELEVFDRPDGERCREPAVLPLALPVVPPDSLEPEDWADTVLRKRFDPLTFLPTRCSGLIL